MAWFGSAFAVFVVAVVLFQVVRARKVGPRVHWVPPRWREPLNRIYANRGWPEPYGPDGSKRSFWEPHEGVTTPAEDRAARLVRSAIVFMVAAVVVVVVVQLARS